MSGVAISQDELARAVRDWRHVADLLEETRRDFAEVGTAMLPASVGREGAAFVGAWRDLAAGGARDASAFVTSLEETLRDFGRVEDAIGAVFAGCADRLPAGSDLLERLGACG